MHTILKTALGFFLLLLPAAAADTPRLRFATTTSVQDSGLLVVAFAVNIGARLLRRRTA